MTTKGQKDKQRSTKPVHKTKDRVTWTPPKAGDELRCSGRAHTQDNANYGSGKPQIPKYKKKARDNNKD